MLPDNGIKYPCHKQSLKPYLILVDGQLFLNKAICLSCATNVCTNLYKCFDFMDRILDRSQSITSKDYIRCQCTHGIDFSIWRCFEVVAQSWVSYLFFVALVLVLNQAQHQAYPYPWSPSIHLALNLFLTQTQTQTSDISIRGPGLHNGKNETFFLIVSKIWHPFIFLFKLPQIN